MQLLGKAISIPKSFEHVSHHKIPKISTVFSTVKDLPENNLQGQLKLDMSFPEAIPSNVVSTQMSSVWTMQIYPLSYLGRKVLHHLSFKTEKSLYIFELMYLLYIPIKGSPPSPDPSLSSPQFLLSSSIFLQRMGSLSWLSTLFAYQVSVGQGASFHIA